MSDVYVCMSFGSFGYKFGCLCQQIFEDGSFKQLDSMTHDIKVYF